MQRFSTRLIKSGFGATAALLPNDLVLTPQSWSARDRGGCDSCTVQATGSGEALASLAGWLGDRLEISNEAGDLVWWGVLWDLEINLGNVTLSLSLDNIYNRVAVIYPHILGDGTTESRTTAWVEDATSIARYGARELLYGLPASFTSSAESVRDTLLERFKMAQPVIQSQASSTYGASLGGKGLWHKAGAVYFTNLDGLVEHQGESGVLTIGRYMESDQISFGTLTPGGEADEIHIATGDFNPLTTGDSFTLSGATNGANNDTFSVEGQDASNQISISGSFVAEAAGATVRISLGESISYYNLALSFVPSTTWVCTHVAVKCRQVGSPSDNFRIGLYPDSGGEPGTVLTVNETAGSALYTELTWTEFAFSTPVTLTGGTTYWLGIRRTGSASLDDGYEVALDEDLGYAGGVARVHDGTAWITRTPDTDVPFRVIGEIDSTAQLAKAVAAVDAFSSSLIEVDSNIPIRQYSEDERTALQEMEEMLDAGMSTGERLVAWVTRDNTLVVTSETVAGYGDSLLVLGGDGKLRFGGGGDFPPGRLIYGQRVEMESLLLLDGVSVRASGGPLGAIYVVESTYEATTDTLTVASEGAVDPFHALTIQKG